MFAMGVATYIARGGGDPGRGGVRWCRAQLMRSRVGISSRPLRADKAL